jgi:hypothetical protein
MSYVDIIEVDLNDFDCPVHAHVIAMTDVFRQQVLFREGGIYSDGMIFLKVILMKNGD